MKKILFTAIMLVGLTGLSNAQVKGVGINTSIPAATLDVVADNATVTMPDGVLVPRMTENQLAAKNSAYGNDGVDAAKNQNGALVFVTAVDGATTAKTINVTAVGFYYYDGPSATWKTVGGSGSAIAQRYESIRGGVATVTTASYTIGANDYLIYTQNGSGVSLTFPDLTLADAGRVVLVFNDNPGLASNTISGVTGQIGNNGLRGRTIAWTGAKWVSIGL